ncbi:DUF4400 domain-containing protein [Vreelandella massiliensis]|uniref:DUF4400 domain-containing protein n=1 Tax=Vreelandella massiliensis TaxID=1816686 RepID=UPI00096A2729|nr:DUF4400 domain-containing protein [Halomonas massiliensis]
MKLSFGTILIIFAVQLLLILTLVPGEWTEQVIEKEAVKVQRVLGTETQQWIHDTAQRWYDTSMIESGAYEAMHSHVIPSLEQRTESRGMEDLGTSIFAWAEDRLAAMMRVIYQVYARVAMALLWAPYLLILLVPAIFDGVMRWKIKQTNFDYASPVVSRYGVRGVFLIGQITLIAFLLPLALNPLLIPLGMMLSSVMLGLTIANYQKRL